MRFPSSRFSHAAALVLGLSLQLVHGETINLSVQQFDDLVQRKLWELNGLGETLNDIIDMVTRTATFGPGAVGTAQWPTLESSITQSTASIRAAGQLTAAAAPRSATIANALADLIDNVPNMQITLHSDIWGARDGQPYAQNLWTRIRELADYLTNSGNVNLNRASSLLMWLYDGNFDPIVGVYVLDVDKKFDLQIAAGYISGQFESKRDDTLDLLAAYRVSLNNMADQQLAGQALFDAEIGTRLVSEEFLVDYAGVFSNLEQVIQDLDSGDNPRGLANLLNNIPVPPGGHANVDITFGEFGL
ncbi:hypothetical protein TWF730_008017 [Orbilia blumenaviensis]|uniref:Uncharacterized protein n=1 Tax=Orbilia blumenaviensis TaxID=1796055 RepID=A0AAV9V9J6_9PEZI